MSESSQLNLAMNGSNVVVTGASSGIGRAVAIEMARQGAKHVLVHYRSNLKGAEDTAAQVRSQGAEVTLKQADLSIDSDRRSLVDSAFRRDSSIHAWVNNAGVDVLTGEVANLAFEEKLERLLAVDVMGTILLSRLVVDRWSSECESGLPSSMVFIGWDQASEGMEGEAGQMFGPVKAAVSAFASNLAQSIAPGIRVNTVAPGWVKTAWGSDTTDYWSDRAKSQSLMARWGTPEDVARAIVFLSSPKSDFITGQTINVNGGWNRRFERKADS